MSQENFTQLPGNSLTNLYVNGLQLAITGNTTLNVNVGQARDSTNSFDIAITTALSIDLSFVGAGGLDTGTVAANSGYYVYVLYDESQANPTAVVASLSFTGPLMPTVFGVTYSQFRLIGFVTTDAFTHLLTFTTSGDVNDRYVQLTVPYPVLVGGTANTLTDVALTPIFPASNFGRVKVNFKFTPFVAGNTAIVQTYIDSGIVATVLQTELLDILPSVVSNLPVLSYVLSTASASLDIDVIGFEMSL